MVNNHNLERHLTGFFIPNEDLLPKSEKLITVGPKVTNVRIGQAGKSLAFILQTHSQHAFNVMSPSTFQLSTLVWEKGINIMPSPF